MITIAINKRIDKTAPTIAPVLLPPDELSLRLVIAVVLLTVVVGNSVVVEVVVVNTI